MDKEMDMIANKAKKRGCPQNFIKLNERPPEEAEAIRQKAHEARRRNAARRRTLKEWALVIGSEEVQNKLGEVMARDGVMILQQYNKAMKGDTAAAKFLAELLGEMAGFKDMPKFDQTITLKID